MSQQLGIFLRAEWRHLVMINYEIDPAVLAPLVPGGTELDVWDGRTLVSMVGFRFLNTRVWGLAIPWHTTFEEVNLRFYVRRRSADGWRRAVVFVTEIVPRPAIALAARLLYHEPYRALPMRHTLERDATGALLVRYEWLVAGRWQALWATTSGEAQPPLPDSAAAFITEHYWGYNRQPDGRTIEYQVEHPPWRVWSVTAAGLDCQVAGLYGPAYVDSLTATPHSAFVADGSPIIVRHGRRLG